MEILMEIANNDLLKVGDIVKFYGASEEQIKWGSNDNPNLYLKVNEIYEIIYVEYHSWHTKIKLKNFEGYKFNSSSFNKVIYNPLEYFKQKDLDFNEWQEVCHGPGNNVQFMKKDYYS